MKIITFLGAGSAYPTVYVMPNGQATEAKFCGIAVAQAYPQSDMCVFVTKKADETHFAEFAETILPSVRALEKIEIPDGRTDDEMWEIFTIIVNAVNQDEELVFDTTHGLRSLSFLSFLVVSYLRIVKSVRIEAVLYGNYEMRDQSTTPHQAPVNDLTTFVSLLDWMSAAKRFTDVGDSTELARLIQDEIPKGANVGQVPELQKQAGELRAAAEALRAVSQSLRMLRPHDAMLGSNKLQLSLLNATQSFQMRARPFLPLARAVVDSYQQIALSKDALATDLRSALETERRLARWYLERRQYAQSIAIAREWLPTWALVQIGETDILDGKKRQAAEHTLTGLARQGWDKEKQAEAEDDTLPSDIGARVAALDGVEQVSRLVDRINQLRNDLLHAGKRKNAMSAEKLEREIMAAIEQLDTIYI